MDNPTTAEQTCIDSHGDSVLANKDADNAQTPAYPARNPAVIRAVLAHAELRHTQVETARALGIHQSTVSRILAEWQPSVDLARKRLEASALDAAGDWVDASKAGAKMGNHRPAKELLQAIGVVQQDANSISQAVVIVGDGDVAIGQAPTFACSTQQLSSEKHQPSGDVGSDNGGYVVNHAGGTNAHKDRSLAAPASLDEALPGARSDEGPSPTPCGGMAPENLS